MYISIIPCESSLRGYYPHFTDEETETLKWLAQGHTKLCPLLQPLSLVRVQGHLGVNQLQLEQRLGPGRKRE